MGLAGFAPYLDVVLFPALAGAQPLLFEQHANRTSEDWVFANRKGRRDGHILQKLKKVCRRTHIKTATVHALRHSFGAHLRIAVTPADPNSIEDQTLLTTGDLEDAGCRVLRPW